MWSHMVYHYSMCPPWTKQCPCCAVISLIQPKTPKIWARPTRRGSPLQSKERAPNGHKGESEQTAKNGSHECIDVGEIDVVFTTGLVDAIPWGCRMVSMSWIAACGASFGGNCDAAGSASAWLYVEYLDELHKTCPCGCKQWCWRLKLPHGFCTLERRTEKSCGVRTAGVMRAMGMTVVSTSSAQSNNEGGRHIMSSPVVSVAVHTSFVPSFPVFLTPHTLSLAAIWAMMHATSLIDNTAVGLGNVGAAVSLGEMAVVLPWPACNFFQVFCSRLF